MNKFNVSIISAITVFLIYAVVGTSGNVSTIKSIAPDDMKNNRNWVILRYEGYKFGSFDVHGGTVYYHVANVNDMTIQYRVKIALWDGELQYYYNAPETLNRINLDSNNITLKLE